MATEAEKIEDGGPAFPFAATDVSNIPLQTNGMSLRDHFAAQALVPFMHWALDQKIFEDYDTAAKAAGRYAKSSYLVADAMLKARKGEAS